MAQFGSSSRKRLDTCDPRLVEIFEQVITIVDCTIIEGRRNKEDQDEYFRTGRSKVKWPNSKHNVLNPTDLSRAVDAAPWFVEAPHIRWNDKAAFYHFAGVVRAVAALKGYKLRWGGDWDSDFVFDDQTFMDLPHFELVD